MRWIQTFSRRATATPPSALGTCVVLFGLLHLTLLFLYTPQGLLNVYSDYYFYFQTAQLTEQGRYPFINMWYEYPPLAAYLPYAAYALTRWLMPPGDIYSPTYQIYARLLGLFLLGFETGNLILLHRLAEKIWGLAQADWVGWVYTALSLPLFFWQYAHHLVVTFLVLAALYAFILNRRHISALLVGLGIAFKLTPVFLLAPAVKFLWPRWRAAGLYGLLVGAVAVAVYVPFICLDGGPWVWASFVALAKGGSWATPWAWLDGNWGPGTYGPLTTRLQLAEAWVLRAHPPLVPAWVVLLGFAGLYAWFWFRPLPGRDPRRFIWFTTLTAVGMHLWSKGWSPAWASLIVPLLLLVFPDRRGLGLTLVFSGIVFLEWPLADALRWPLPGWPGSNLLLALAIGLRTVFFVGLGGWLVRQLWPNLKLSRPVGSPEK